MEIILEIDSLLDAIDRELCLLNSVTKKMNFDLDTEAVQDMTSWLDKWEPFEEV